MAVQESPAVLAFRIVTAVPESQSGLVFQVV